MSIRVFVITLLMSAGSYGQSELTPADAVVPGTAVESEAATEKSFEFNKLADEKKAAKQPHARLKLSQKKEGLFLEFEGQRLAKGSYVLAKVPQCDKKSLKSLPEGAELMNFQTSFGDISSENTLANQTLASLELSKNKIALVKKEKAKIVLLFCAE